MTFPFILIAILQLPDERPLGVRGLGHRGRGGRHRQLLDPSHGERRGLAEDRPVVDSRGRSHDDDGGNDDGGIDNTEDDDDADDHDDGGTDDYQAAGANPHVRAHGASR